MKLFVTACDLDGVTSVGWLALIVDRVSARRRGGGVGVRRRSRRSDPIIHRKAATRR